MPLEVKDSPLKNEFRHLYILDHYTLIWGDCHEKKVTTILLRQKPRRIGKIVNRFVKCCSLHKDSHFSFT